MAIRLPLRPLLVSVVFGLLVLVVLTLHDFVDYFAIGIPSSD